MTIYLRPVDFGLWEIIVDGSYTCANKLNKWRIFFVVKRNENHFPLMTELIPLHALQMMGLIEYLYIEVKRIFFIFHEVKDKSTNHVK